MNRVAAVVGAALLLLGGGHALAHANYVRSVPEADARLGRPPTEVRVSFSEAIEARFSEIQVLDVAGARKDDGRQRLVDPATLAVGLQPTEAGGFTVSWRVLSAVDGHETRGSFVFAVGDAPLPAPPDEPPSPPPSAVELLGRLFSYAGVALLFGVPLFAIAVARRDEDRRGVGVLARAGAGAILVGIALLLLDRPDPLSVLADSRLGKVFAARAVVATAALVLPGLRTWLLYGAIAAATLTAQSHAAAYGDALEIAADLAHITAAASWVGGLVMLGLVALPRRRADSQRAARDLGELVGRFSALGVTAVGTILLTGAVQSVRRLLDPRDLIETPYGLALLAKILLLGAAVSLAALNILRHGPRLRAARDATSTRRLLLWGVRGEVALVAAVLVAVSVLTALVPPSTPSGAAYSAVQHAAGLRIELDVRSPLPGQNRYVVRLREGLEPAADVEKVALRFTMIEHDMGEQELVARERAPGEYVASGSPTSMYGTWRVQVVALRTGHEEARATFTVPVATPVGGGTARLVQAGSLQLVVFTDPSAPVAGQPITLSLVAIDPAGNAFSGAAITVELEEKSYSATAEAGGRYRVDLPALAAGEKVARIVVATPAGDQAGEYAFTVGR